MKFLAIPFLAPQEKLPSPAGCGSMCGLPALPCQGHTLTCRAATPAHSHSAQAPCCQHGQGLSCIPAMAFGFLKSPLHLKRSHLQSPLAYFSGTPNPPQLLKPEETTTAHHHPRHQIPFQAPKSSGKSTQLWIHHLSPRITCFTLSSCQHSCDEGAWNPR